MDQRVSGPDRTGPTETPAICSLRVHQRTLSDVQVESVSSQSGVKTESTSSVVIWPTGRRRIGLAYSCNVIFHCTACFPLRQAGRMALYHAISAFAERCAFRGPSPWIAPSASLAHACEASSRARASVTSRAEPNPISVGLPCQRNRKTHRRPPFGEIER